MNTYNFEQAMEHLAQRLPVKRLTWVGVELWKVFDKAEILNKKSNSTKVYEFSFEDFYATDWIDATEQ